MVCLSRRRKNNVQAIQAIHRHFSCSYHLLHNPRRSTSVSTLAADGSDLIFDYADDGLFQAEERRVQNMLAMAKAGGEEMKSCFDQMSLELMLSSYHFLTYEHLSRREIQNRFFSERNDWLSAFEHINYVHAVLRK